MASLRRVFVAMSGGVDSSVAAALLKKQGHAVTGVFMRNWEDDDGSEECSSLSDWLDAQRVCDKLQIELLQTNFSKEYKEQVWQPYVALLSRGSTPNPDVLCNSMIKFAHLRDFAFAAGAAQLATGHYARLLVEAGRTLLYQAEDHTKCQTYFLYRVPDFSGCLMPLGELQKSQVRQLAKKFGLHNHSKKDSTGICFIGKRNFSNFISRYLPDQPGEIIDQAGQVLGKHKGLFHYTIGQRQGLGLGGSKQHKDLPWFVVAKDVANNTLLVGQGQADQRLWTTELTASSLNWLGEPPALPLACSAKIRYRAAEVACRVTAAAEDDAVTVVFKQPQRAVTAGQSVVFYQSSRCLGGGIIL